MTTTRRTSQALVDDYVLRRSQTRPQPARQRSRRLQPEAKSPLKAVADEDILPDQSGDVTIYRDGAATERKEEAWLNWMHSDQQVSAGKKVIIQWFSDEAKWVITHAECE